MIIWTEKRLKKSILERKEMPFSPRDPDHRANEWGRPLVGSSRKEWGRPGVGSSRSGVVGLPTVRVVVLVKFETLPLHGGRFHSCRESEIPIHVSILRVL